MRSISKKDYNELKKLFLVSFGENKKISEEILGYAKDYGRIHYLKEDGKIATMLCVTELEDNLKYMFAVATNPDYRNKGLFRKNFTESFNKDDKIICIPENKSLFALYEKLGFNKHGHILLAEGDDTVFLNHPCTDNADFDMLYEIYKNTLFYPKKSRHLFFSTINYHLLSGGKIIYGNNFYALAYIKNDSKYISELCLPRSEEERLPDIVRGEGNEKVMYSLDLRYESILRKNRIPSTKERVFALTKNTKKDKMYINILYN